MRVEREERAADWRLVWAACECGAPECDSGFLLAQAPDDIGLSPPPAQARWLVLSMAPEAEWADEQLEIARVSLEQNEEFEEAARCLAECYGWPLAALDETLACVSYARMMNVSDDLSDELAHWGPVGVRGLRRLAGQSPASCEAALLCVRRARLDDGGGRVTAGPLAR